MNERLSDRFAPCATPPYYVAILTSQFCGTPELRDRATNEAYRLAARNPAFLGAEQTRDETGFGILLTYWRDRAALEAWNLAVFEQVRQEFGYDEPFTIFRRRVMRVARVESIDEMTGGALPAVARNAGGSHAG